MYFLSIGVIIFVLGVFKYRVFSPILILRETFEGIKSPVYLDRGEYIVDLLRKCAIAWILFLIGALYRSIGHPTLGILIILGAGLFLVVALINTNLGRLKDKGSSYWWIVFSFVPVVNIAFFIIQLLPKVRLFDTKLNYRETGYRYLSDLKDDINNVDSRSALKYKKLVKGLLESRRINKAQHELLLVDISRGIARNLTIELKRDYYSPRDYLNLAKKKRKSNLLLEEDYKKLISNYEKVLNK